MIRIGTGYDVHRLVPERKLILCGVEVPCELGLLGHSDADVAVHALMDAILGALAMGDIGKLFPDSDPQYKGADSMKLLAEVIRRMEGAGFRLGNLDLTIIAERPKLSLIHISEPKRQPPKRGWGLRERVSVRRRQYFSKSKSGRSQIRLRPIFS